MLKVIVTTLFLVTAVHADQLVSRLGDSPEFKTLDAAATAALHAVMTPGARNESGGGLIRCGDVYGYTDPVTGDGAEISFGVAVPVRCQLVGTYHTHPDTVFIAGGGTQFSPIDVRTAEKLKIRVYIGVLSDFSVRVFDPATMKPDRGSQSIAGSPATGVILAMLNAERR